MGEPVVNALFALGGVCVGALVTLWNTGRINRTAVANAHLADGTVRANAERVDETTRSLKLSDHRVAWIQKLRDEMAVFLSWGETPFVDHFQNRGLVESGARVLLLMNADDPEYDELAQYVRKYQSALDMNVKYALHDNYVAVCQRILKREWAVVRTDIRSGRTEASQAMFQRGKRPPDTVSA